MAGDWTKLEWATLDKPEIGQMAAILKVEDPDIIVAKCLRLWKWADEQSRNGHAPSVTLSFLDAQARLPGMAEAMQEVGWLEITPDGTVFPNWDRHNSKSAKDRALGYRRQQRARESVTKMSRSERDKNVTKPELRDRVREQSKEKNPLKPPTTSGADKAPSKPAGTIRSVDDIQPWPAELSEGGARDAIQEWLEYKAEKNQRYKPRGARQLVKRLAEMGAKRTVAAIVFSMSQNYQGIFEPGDNNRGGTDRRRIGALEPEPGEFDNLPRSFSG